MKFLEAANQWWAYKIFSSLQLLIHV